MATEYVVNFDVFFLADNEEDAKAVRDNLTRALEGLPDVFEVLPSVVETL